MRGEEVDEERHEEALALDLLDLAGTEDFFEEDALVGYVLIDDPEETLVVRAARMKESPLRGSPGLGVSKLAEGV